MYNKATESEIFVRETSSIIMYLYKEVNNPLSPTFEGRGALRYKTKKAI